MNTIEIKTDLSGEELQVLIWELEAFCEGKRLPKPVLRQADFSSSLPTLEQSKKAMLRRKTKFVDNMDKFSSRKNAYKQGWRDCCNWIMSQGNDR